MLKIRCKFQLVEVTEFVHGGRKYKFAPQYDTSIPEDQRFAKASPSGEFTIYVDNPEVHKEWKVGQYYYFDATPVIAEPAS